MALAPQPSGVRFHCPPPLIAGLEKDMDAYLATLLISPDWVVKKVGVDSLLYTLSTPASDTRTTDLYLRPEYEVRDEIVFLPNGPGQTRAVETVSKKEIVLALLQHGRLTEFAGHGCDLEVLKDHVGIRQNIVAWTEKLSWIWPDGGSAAWNQKYWHRGTPLKNVPMSEAFRDAFINQDKYAIGCFTAAKLAMAQGILDYYDRVRPAPPLLRLVEERLMLDGDPLVNVEPGETWELDPKDPIRPGKVLKIQFGIAPRNLVPGDWSYLRNTDPKTRDKTGYEGSNAIYLGRNRLDDFYNDHNHYYRLEEKLDEVYQWRNGVFSRSHHAALVKPLTRKELDRLALTPAEGGVFLDFRVFPYFFGAEILPEFARPISEK